MSRGPFGIFLWDLMGASNNIKLHEMPFLWLKACSTDDADGSGNT